MSGCLEKYLPAFVTIISVPSEWNSSHKLFISKSTLAFISPLHNGLDAAACEQEDWTGGGLEAGELPVSLSSSESSGIRCWLFTPLTGALFPVPTFMRRSEIEIKSTDDNERSGKPQERHLGAMIDGARDVEATHLCVRVVNYLPFREAVFASSSGSSDSGAKMLGLRVVLCRSSVQ